MVYSDFAMEKKLKKICNNCKKLLPANEFYSIKEGNGSARLEPYCKLCKKLKRKKKIGKSPPGSSISDNPSNNVSINTPPSSNVSDKSYYPEKKLDKNNVKGLNFDHWDDRYGRKLSEMEHLEIYTNLTSLFKILMEENKKNEQQ